MDNLNTTLQLTKRRGVYYNIAEILPTSSHQLSENDEQFFEKIDVIYRTLCGILFNFVPTSGHPGGSISSGRAVEMLLYQTMDYDFTNPDMKEADIISYAAGHKAMGLYAMWALRNELVRLGNAKFLAEEKRQLRLEDLLGFRRNPTNETPLFKKYKAKPLDGHPTCATPFIKIATGASGVGIPATLGLALGALDTFGENSPRVNMLEGEGGMTPGRVHEALAAAATTRMFNAFLHVDWNQASIDSNRVCSENEMPGDYVQWNPMELCYVHDWNVIFVPEGHNFKQIFAAQQLALQLNTQQPTAIIYRTTKGWKYGVQGKDSHGAGHKFCSDGYYNSLKEFEETFGVTFPRLIGEQTANNVEQTYFDSLMTIRKVLENNPSLTKKAAEKISASQRRLISSNRKQKENATSLVSLYANKEIDFKIIPDELKLEIGSAVTLRDVLGKSLNYLNKKTNGAILASAADLLGSTSVNQITKGFGEGFYNAVSNTNSRLISIGGICEDAMGAMMAGLSSYGNHIGVTSSYSAFIAALEHVAARLHGIGQQTREAITGEPYNTWIMVNAHAGVKTGEDGPTHADPQALQLLQECFPDKVMITLTPWDPQEIWSLLVAALQKRPAILAPFVTRPADKIVDRKVMGLPSVNEAANGIYAMRRADVKTKQYNGTIVLQGNGVASIFVNEVLQKLEQEGLNLNVFYVTSVELYKLLSKKKQETIFPEALTYEAMGITDFTLPTMYQWIRSNEGIERSLHSFRGGHYLGSGSAAKVLEEAGIHGKGQLKAIMKYAREIEKKGKRSKK